MRTMLVASALLAVSAWAMTMTAFGQDIPAAAPEAAAPKAAEPTAEPAAESPKAPEASGLATPREKVGYAIGFDIGTNFRRQQIDVDPAMLAKGIADAMTAAKPLMTQEQMLESLTAFRRELVARHEERMKAIAEKNKTEGETFLAENGKKEGVVTLPSGLQYKVLTEGAGQLPKIDDFVTTHYRGTLIDGTEFDSSHRRGEPATFPVRGVIAGWTEALQLMKVGSKWQLTVPASLAYADRGAGPLIGPNATLIFEIELISIEKAPAEEPPGTDQP